MELKFKWEEGSRGRDFKVTIKFTAQLNSSLLNDFVKGKINYFPQEVIQALDVIARHQAAQRQVIVGNSLFTDEGARAITGGVEIWSGYFFSLRIGMNGLLANIDTSFTGFYRSGSVIDYLEESSRFVCLILNFLLLLIMY